MDFLIVTGLSGAGKSRAMDALEDIGFFCIDNMPPALMFKFAQMYKQADTKIPKLAIGIDARSGQMFKEFANQIGLLKENLITYKILFLDCADETLVSRYKETRRKHPLVSVQTQLKEAIAMDREFLMPAREQADYIIDTTILSPIELKERINSIFLDNIQNSMMINTMSFGFKYGIPTEADLVLDVRCLPNPFYIDEMKHKTGLDNIVSEYVMSFGQSQKLLEKTTDLIDYLLPLYLSEGKSQLTIAFGCTGGKHRSVTFAEKLYSHIANQGKKVCVNHRDILKK